MVRSNQFNAEIFSKLMECPVTFGTRRAKDFSPPRNMDPNKNEMVSLRDKAGREIFILNTYIGEDEYRIQSQVKYYCYGCNQELLEEIVIPLSGRFLAAEFDSSGRLVIILAQKSGNPDEYAIFYSQEEFPGTHRFSPAIKLTGIRQSAAVEPGGASEAADEVNLRDIVVRKADKSFKFGIKYSNDGNVYFMECDWGRSGPHTTRIGNADAPWYPVANFGEDRTYGSMVMSIIPGSLTKAFFIDGRRCQIVYEFTLPTDYVAAEECLYLSYDYSLVHLTSAQNDAVAMLDFTVASGLGVKILLELPRSGGGSFHWDAKWENPSDGGAPHCHVLIQGRNNLLQHAVIDFSLDQRSYQVKPAFPLCRNAFFHNLTGAFDLGFLFYRADSNAYVAMAYDYRESQWSEYVLDVASEVIMERGYSMEIYFSEPEHRIPIIGGEVEIWADTRVLIETNTGYHYIGKEHRVRLKTDAQGMIYIVQFTDTLDAVPVKVAMPSRMKADECLEINPSVKIQDRLRGIGADAIYDARETDSISGEECYLLAPEYRTRENARALADSLAEGLTLTRLIANPYDADGCRKCRRNGLSDQRIAPENAAFPAWRLQVDGNRLIFEKLSHEAAQNRIAAMRYREDGVELPGWLTAIGDFFYSIGKAAVKFTEIVVDGIKAVVNVIIDGVCHVVRVVVDTLGKVMRFVESVFSAVKVAFEKLFKWLGFIFKWRDILSAKDALNGTLTVVLNQLPAVAELGKVKMLEFIKRVDDDLSDIFDQAIASLLPDQGIGNFVEQTAPPDQYGYRENIGNNILMRRLNGVGMVEVLSADELNACRDGVQSLLEEIEKFITDLQMKREFDAAVSYLENTFNGDVKNFFSCMLAALLKGIQLLCKLVVAGLGVLVTILFDGLKEILELLKTILLKKLDIPFFSALYRKIAGNDLSMLDLCSLILALPITIIYKLITNEAPFADQAEIDAFIEDIKSAFPEHGTQRVAASGQYYYSKKTRTALEIASAICGGAYGFVGAYLDRDMKPNTGRNESALSLSALFALVTEFAWCITSLPLFFAKTPPTGSENGGPPWDVVTWSEWLSFGYFGFGCLLDTLFTIPYGEWIDKHSATATGIYGIGHFVVLLTSAIADFDGATLATELSCCGTELSKFVPKTDPMNLMLIVGMDALCGFFVAIIGLTQVAENRCETGYALGPA